MFPLSLLILLLALIELDRCRRRHAPDAAWSAAFLASMALWIWTKHPLAVVACVVLFAAAWVSRRSVRAEQDDAGLGEDEPAGATVDVEDIAQMAQTSPDGEVLLVAEFPDHPEFDPDPPPLVLATLPSRASRLEHWLAAQGHSLPAGHEGLEQLDVLLRSTLADRGRPGSEELLIDFGACLGERIRLEEGGQWDEDPEFGPCLAGLRGSPVRAFPLAKVRARLDDPDSAPLPTYWQSLTDMIDESLRQTS